MASALLVKKKPLPVALRRVENIRTLAEEFDRDPDLRARVLAADPIGAVRRFCAPADREVAAFLAASIALGKASIIRAKQLEIWDRLGGRPSDPAPRGAWRGFKHRFFTGEDLARFHGRILAARAEEPLAKRFVRAWSARAPSFPAAVSVFLSEVFPKGTAARGPGGLPLLPSPADGSAAKRTFLLLRWLLRPDDGIDLGLWRVAGAPPTSALVLPLDTHTFRILRLNGLIRRRTPGLAAALEATAALAEIDSEDPTRFDLPIAHQGILSRCVGRWREDLCRACVLRTSCRAARGRVS